MNYKAQTFLWDNVHGWVGQCDKGEGAWLRGDCLVKEDPIHRACELQLYFL